MEDPSRAKQTSDRSQAAEPIDVDSTEPMIQAEQQPPYADAPDAPASGDVDDGGDGGHPTPQLPNLRLTDFLDAETLQEIQDAFTAVTRLITTIRNAEGDEVTHPTDSQLWAESDLAFEQLMVDDALESGEVAAPIVVEGQELGSITVEPRRLAEMAPAAARHRLEQLAQQLQLDRDKAAELIDAAVQTYGGSRAASIQFLYLLANSISRLCYQEYHARKRVEELSVLYKVSRDLADNRHLQQVLETAARSVADVMGVKAASIRMIRPGEDEDELVVRAVYNLSEHYINKGVLNLTVSELFQEALKGRVVYVQDMAADPRIIYRDDADREGLVSMLCAGITHQERPIGVLQLFTGEVRRFSRHEIDLVQAIAQLIGTAIVNKRLDQERQEGQRVLRQLHLAADVQRRMLPRRMPDFEPFDIAARYVPSMELAGDFYDFINLDHNLGLVVGDVVGKGVAASLLMASVRASLRAYAQDLYDLDEVISRVNYALSRDTLPNEFATLWYGVLDQRTMRVTYCNAGHEPPMLVRDGKVHALDVGGMLVGVDQTQRYEKGICDLKVGDLLVLYTDGLLDAFNAEGKKFGRDRLRTAALTAATMSTAAAGLSHILRQQRDFTGPQRHSDDTTAVVIKVKARS